MGTEGFALYSVEPCFGKVQPLEAEYPIAVPVQEADNLFHDD